MTEHTRANRTDGRKVRTVSWQCRYCERITTWEQPESLRVYKYRVCAECASIEWAGRVQDARARRLH